MSSPLGSLGGSDSKEFVCNVGDAGLIAGSGSPLEKGLETHSSILEWRFPWSEGSGGLQSEGLPRVRHG